MGELIIMKKIAILGSTGSIGTQTLNIIRKNPEKYHACALTCKSRLSLIAEQIVEFRPEYAVVSDREDALKLKSMLAGRRACSVKEDVAGGYSVKEDVAGGYESGASDVETADSCGAGVSVDGVERDADADGHSTDADAGYTRILWGREGLKAAASEIESDIVLNALVGMAGLEPTYYAVLNGKTVALANKETLVAGGSLIMETAKRTGAVILPVDSEHSAVFQCLQGYDERQVERIILTASGGPFRGKKADELKNVTLAQALNHPRWKMGSKITIDSSTLMNKGFEVIEARWLFDISPSKIDVVVHPESIIHSMVEYNDGAVMAQLGLPDMEIPISLALEFPKRLPNKMKRLNLADVGSLTFEHADTDTFKCLQYAYDALEAGDTFCTALNAANEIAVAAFLAEKISYSEIQDCLGKVLERHIPQKNATLEDILAIDEETRKIAAEILGVK